MEMRARDGDEDKRRWGQRMWMRTREDVDGDQRRCGWGQEKMEMRTRGDEDEIKGRCG